MDTIENRLVKTSELALILGLTGRRVQQLIEDGIFEKQDGRLDLATSVRAYIAFLRRERKPEDEYQREIRRAEVSLLESKAQVAKLRARSLKRSMYTAEEVRETVNAISDAIELALRDFAANSELLERVATVTEPAEAAAVLRTYAHEMLRCLSETTFEPEEMEKTRVRLEELRKQDEWRQRITDSD